MAAIFYRQLTLGQGSLAKPGLCLADYSNTAGLYSSTTGISGDQTKMEFGVGGVRQLALDSSGVTARALGITTPYSLAANSRIVTWDNSNGRIGIMPLPASDGLAIIGTAAGGLSWGTVTPGTHSHFMSTGQMVFDAALTPQTTGTRTLGSSSLVWSGLFVTGLRVESGATYLSAASAASFSNADVLFKDRTSNLVSSLTSPTSGTKVLKWSANLIFWGDEATGGSGGIPEAPLGGGVYGRGNSSWTLLALPPWSVSQINFNGNVVPTSNTLDLGSSTGNRWGLYANAINASGRATIVGGLTLSGAITQTTPTNHSVLIRDESTGVVGASDSGDLKTWLGLGSAVTGSGSTYGLTFWDSPNTISSASARWQGGAFQFEASVQINGFSLSITGGETLWVSGVKLPSLQLNTAGDYILRSTGSAGAENRLSWATPAFPFPSGGTSGQVLKTTGNATTTAGLYWDNVGGGSVTGSGAVNQLAIWSSTTTNLGGLANDSGSKYLRAGTPPSWTFVAYSELSNKPITLAGFGITDAYTKAEVFTKNETISNINAAFPQAGTSRPDGTGTWAHLERAEFQINMGWVLAQGGTGGVGIEEAPNTGLPYVRVVVGGVGSWRELKGDGIVISVT